MSLTIVRDRRGNELGELRDASGRSIRFPFLRTSSYTGSVRADNPLAYYLTLDDQTILSYYDLAIQTDPLFQGPVVGHQKQRDASGGTIQFTAAGMDWRLQHRLLGRSNSGATFGTNPLTKRDRGAMIADLIAALNGGDATNIFTSADNTGLRVGQVTPSSSTYIDATPYAQALPFIEGLTGTFDGPDLRIRPVEPFTDAQGVVFAYVDVAPSFGVVQPNVAFEFGFGQHNVESWTDVGDAGALANDVICLPPNFPDNATTTPLERSDAPSIAAHGLHEDAINVDLLSDDLRAAAAQLHVNVRRQPRRTISFVPIAEDATATDRTRRVPRLGYEFDLGDTIVFRAVERFPITQGGTAIGYQRVPTVDLLMRVYGAEVAIDDNGIQRTTLTLQADGS